MRRDHLLCIILTPIAQAILALASAFNAPGAVSTKPLALLALVVPVPIYIWGLRDATLGLKTSRRAIRLTALVLLACVLAFAGYGYGWMMVAAYPPGS